MEKLDIDEIIRKNPHLDRESLEALRKYLQKVTPAEKTRYRLAPLGTRRVIANSPDQVPEKPKRLRSYPGF